jgi:nucleotide-binding universal stress UspA family protein
MNIRSILFPTDFSDYNNAALEFASRLAAESNAKLHIAYVHEPQDLNAALGEASYYESPSSTDELSVARERLARVTPAASPVAFEHHFLIGSPASEIVALAKEKTADLIVMASHGRTGLSRLVLGSVAEGVMRKASCPVLIVKQPSDKDCHDAQLSITCEDTRVL